MRKLCLILVLVCGSFPAYSLATPHELVLVANQNFPEATFTRNEIRRLFLGLPIQKQGVKITPFINNSSGEIKERFFENIVFMTQARFQRYWLKKKMQQGKLQPQQRSNNALLIKALKQNENSISYMWRRDLERAPQLRALQLVWSGE